MNVCSKIKVTLVQALKLCTGRTVHIEVYLYSFMINGTRRGWGVSVTPRSLLTPGKTRYPLYRRLGGHQGQSGQVRKNLAPTGIRSPARPARSQSLYRLCYPARNAPSGSNYFLTFLKTVGLTVSNRNIQRLFLNFDFSLRNFFLNFDFSLRNFFFKFWLQPSQLFLNFDFSLRNFF